MSDQNVTKGLPAQEKQNAGKHSCLGRDLNPRYRGPIEILNPANKCGPVLKDAKGRAIAQAIFFFGFP
jgi:hypothetical protein